MQDIVQFEKFVHVVQNLVKHAIAKNCTLYFDAEHNANQNFVESVTQQLTHQYNVGTSVPIMSEYQAYLKRMPKLIKNEIESSKALGYNLGIKFQWGKHT